VTSNFTAFWHWFTVAENPVKLFGWQPVIFWMVWGAMTLAGFIPNEWLGVLRFRGMVPLTWVIRCAPRWSMATAAIVAIWHFMLVVTKVK
jgi:hypothetical protein